jgi:hypothetical protein
MAFRFMIRSFSRRMSKVKISRIQEGVTNPVIENSDAYAEIGVLDSLINKKVRSWFNHE